MTVIAIATMFLGAALVYTAALSASRRSKALVPVRIKRDRR